VPKLQEYRKVRIYFRKTGDAVFLSHLDVMRTMDRALRRSGLPIRFTEGMNPKVKMAFPTALPLGMESRLETMEVQVRPGVALREIRDRLGRELPEGLRPFDADALYTGEKWSVAELHYEVFGDLPSEGEVQALLEQERVPVERRGKVRDLRPLLAALAREEERLTVSILWTDTGTARPDDVLRALGRSPEACRVVKVGMTFLTSLGERIMKTDGSEDHHQ
jgi:radical SAM-linked protein